MIELLAPFAYIAAMFVVVLIVGATALVAGNAPDGSTRPAALALTAALLTWGTLAYVIVAPLPIRWAQSISLSMWVLLSILSAIVFWFCRPIAPDEPPAPPPPPPWPMINGKFTTPSTTTIDADLLRCTYRKKSA